MTNEKKLAAIKVKQWLPEWDAIEFDSGAKQSKPNPYFFLFAINAKDLKALTGVYRRSTQAGTPRAKDPNVQRGHEEARSKLIKEFVKFGYPWCEMSEPRRRAEISQRLQKPGWLPTAIIVNILPRGAERNDVRIADQDTVKVEEESGSYVFNYPSGFQTNGWEPSSIYPMEVIDGQHRLWAFEEFDPGEDFELPVIAFYDLDRSWQAYLFWSVNITPKRINRSLAFDLYPLLRKEDWLDQFAGHSIYRETRCQELVEALWSSTQSPWRGKINMLGEAQSKRGDKVRVVSQAAWIRSLLSSFVKTWSTSDTKIGGLFGASKDRDTLFLPWNRPMQAAVLISAGKTLQAAISETRESWAELLRDKTQPDMLADADAAMFGEFSLLATDQGIRGFLHTFNDLIFVSASKLDLNSWAAEDVYAEIQQSNTAATDDYAQETALQSLSGTKLQEFIVAIAAGLAKYDWRTSAAPEISEADRKIKLIFRGSGGYKELRKELLRHLIKEDGDVGLAAKEVLDLIR